MALSKKETSAIKITKDMIILRKGYVAHNTAIHPKELTSKRGINLEMKMKTFLRTFMATKLPRIFKSVGII